MSKPIYILGTGLSHDGSSCLMKDGKIVVAIEKERLTRKKHDGFNDNLTIEYCLNAENISFRDISLVVQEATESQNYKPEEVVKRANRTIPEDIPKITISHHLAHAYSAIGTSPFDEMSVLVIDGQGSSMDSCIDFTPDLPFSNLYHIDEQKKYWEFLSYYEFKHGKLKTLQKDFGEFYLWNRDELPAAPEDMLNSIGEFYDGISNYIFDKSFCEGKTMGLSSYGKGGVYNFDAFTIKGLKIELKHDWLRRFTKFKSGKYIGFAENFQYFAEIAFWAQQQLEKAVIRCFNNLYKLAPNKNVAYAGGVALNAVINSKIISNTEFENIYIQPAAGDNGLAIGCCYYGWIEYFKKSRLLHSGSTYFGRSYKNSEVFSVLKEYSDVLLFSEEKEYVKIAAELLNDGKIIGWFQDGCEFGPRALGHRSILANPIRKDIRNFINRKIKTREDFRPFAPSVLKEELKNYFECDFTESDYMLKVAKVKQGFADKIPGVVHKDLSARIQTVDSKLTPKYYQLIKEFQERSGIPILLNTSFNGVNMPIIETPKQAIEFFVSVKNIDVLIINDIVITDLKKEV